LKPSANDDKPNDNLSLMPILLNFNSFYPNVDSNEDCDITSEWSSFPEAFLFIRQKTLPKLFWNSRKHVN
jgi:hypothetical protein